MSAPIFIAGTGVITPLGRELPEVCHAVLNKHQRARQSESMAGGQWPCLRVPEAFHEKESRLPRLRRSSAISHFAVAAATDAVAAAGVTAEEAKEIPVLFATSDGGVQYTHRFFSGLTENGAGAGSPLLFPETVYNAPASHIATILGTDREATAIPGDCCAAISALAMASGWLASGDADQVLVVAAQECDPLATAGYSAWGFLGSGTPEDCRLISSEGAAALLLRTSATGIRMDVCREGIPFRNCFEAENHLIRLLEDSVSCDPCLYLPSSEGSPLGVPERNASKRFVARSRLIDAGPTLGETFAAGALLRIALACHLLKSQPPGQSALLTSLGTAGGVAVACLTHSIEQP